MASQINASNSGFGGIVSTGDSSGVLELQTTGTTAVTIDTSQRVGFVAGTAAAPAITRTGDTNTGMFFPAADTIAFAEGGVEAMRLDASGNVGIGTTSPTTGKLVISQNNSVQPAISLPIDESTIQGPSTNTKINMGGNLFLAGNNIATVASYGASGYINFLSNGANERMRIDSSGNVLIGSSTAAGKFYSYNTNNSWGAYVECNSGSLNSGVLALVASRNTSNNTYKAIVYYNAGAGADRFYVTDGGAVYGTGAYNQISDGRLKENVRDIDVGLSSILNLQPRIFDWKENKGSNTKDNIGFIAQEVENVLPHAVSDWTNSQGDETVYKAVSMESMIPVLVKAIQEQQTIINDLKARIETLEAK